MQASVGLGNTGEKFARTSIPEEGSQGTVDGDQMTDRMVLEAQCTYLQQYERGE